MSTSPAPKARTRDRQATEEELVAAAAIAFAERGYEKATTRSIAEAAGCSEGLIQRYFNGKEGLLLAVLKRQGIAERDQFFDRPLCASMQDEVRESLSHGVAAFAKRSERIRIVFSRVLLDRSFRADFNRIHTRPQVQTAVRARLLRYVEAGMVDASLDVGVLTEMLMGFVFQLGFLHRELHETGEAQIEQMIDGFATVFARGVASVPQDKRDTPKRRKQT